METLAISSQPSAISIQPDLARLLIADG